MKPITYFMSLSLLVCLAGFAKAQIVINEVTPDPGNYDCQGGEWIELKNCGLGDIDIGGYFLSTGHRGAAGGDGCSGSSLACQCCNNAADTFVFPPTFVVPAGARVLVINTEIAAPADGSGNITPQAVVAWMADPLTILVDLAQPQFDAVVNGVANEGLSEESVSSIGCPTPAVAANPNGGVMILNNSGSGRGDRLVLADANGTIIDGVYWGDGAFVYPAAEPGFYEDPFDPANPARQFQIPPVGDPQLTFVGEAIVGCFASYERAPNCGAWSIAASRFGGEVWPTPGLENDLPPYRVTIDADSVCPGAQTINAMVEVYNYNNIYVEEPLDCGSSRGGTYWEFDGGGRMTFDSPAVIDTTMNPDDTIRLTATIPIPNDGTLDIYIKENTKSCDCADDDLAVPPAPIGSGVTVTDSVGCGSARECYIIETFDISVAVDPISAEIECTDPVNGINRVTVTPADASPLEYILELAGIPVETNETGVFQITAPGAWTVTVTGACTAVVAVGTICDATPNCPVMTDEFINDGPGAFVGCPGDTVELRIEGNNLPMGAKVRWYQGDTAGFVPETEGVEVGCVALEEQTVTQPVYGSVVINEVSLGNPNGEFIELYCPPGGPCNIGNFVLTDADCASLGAAPSASIVFPDGFTMPADSYLTFGQDGGGFDFLYDADPQLNNSGEPIYLFDNNDNLVDSVSTDGAGHDSNICAFNNTAWLVGAGATWNATREAAIEAVIAGNPPLPAAPNGSFVARDTNGNWVAIDESCLTPGELNNLENTSPAAANCPTPELEPLVLTLESSSCNTDIFYKAVVEPIANPCNMGPAQGTSMPLQVIMNCPEAVLDNGETAICPGGMATILVDLENITGQASFTMSNKTTGTTVPVLNTTDDPHMFMTAEAGLWCIINLRDGGTCDGNVQGESTVTMGAAPNDPVPSVSAIGCVGEVLEFTAIGNPDLNWYEDMAGTTFLGSGSPFVYNGVVAGGGALYVQSVDPDTGCESALVPIAYEANAPPTAPTCLANLEVMIPDSGFLVLAATDVVDEATIDMSATGTGVLNNTFTCDDADASHTVMVVITTACGNVTSDCSVTILSCSEPEIAIAKSCSAAVCPDVNGVLELTCEILVENTGTAPISNLTLLDNLSVSFASVFASGEVAMVDNANAPNISANLSFDGDTDTDLVILAPTLLFDTGEFFTVIVSVFLQDPPCGASYVNEIDWSLTDDMDRTLAGTTSAAPVTVGDTVPPVARCRNITVGPGGATFVTAAELDDGSSDNCGIERMEIDVAGPFTCDQIDPYPVTLTVYDACGNSDSCVATVTVETCDTRIQGFVRFDEVCRGQDPAGVGISNVEVVLFSDPDCDGMTGDVVAVATTRTDASGLYAFTGLVGGCYMVMENDPAGYWSTGDVGFPTNNPNLVALQLSCCMDMRDINFWDTRPVTTTVETVEDTCCSTIVYQVTTIQNLENCETMSSTQTTITANDIEPLACSSFGPTWLGCNPPYPEPDEGRFFGRGDCLVGVTFSHFELSDSNCLFSLTNYYIASNACGQSVTCSERFVWTEDVTPPTMIGIPTVTNTNTCVVLGDPLPLPPVETNLTCTDNCYAVNIATGTSQVVGAQICAGGSVTIDNLSGVADHMNPPAPWTWIDGGPAENGGSVLRTTDGSATWTTDGGIPHFGTPNGSYAGTVVINQVLFEPTVDNGQCDDCVSNPNRPDVRPDGEAIELAGAPGTDISCFLLADGGLIGQSDFFIRIPPGTTIPADGIFVIGFAGFGDVPAVEVDLDLATCDCGVGNATPDINLTDDGEFLALFDDSNTLIDGIIWSEDVTGNQNYPNGQMVDFPALQGENVTQTVLTVSSAVTNCFTEWIGDITNVTPCEIEVRRTYYVADSCGNGVTREQVFVYPIDDMTPPQLLSGPTGIIDLGCNPGPVLPFDPAAYSFYDPTCGVDAVWLSNDVMLAEGPCAFARQLTYATRDACDNSTSIVVILTWIQDNVPPSLATAPAPFLDLGCNPTDMMISNSIPCLASSNVPTGNPWINEVHYDDNSAGGDQDEGFEIAGPAGADLSGWSVVHYSGSTPTVGTVYRTTVLFGTIDNEMNGYGAVWFGLPQNGMQNGPNDGIALVNSSGIVVEFLSYEGVLTAASGEGAAAGMTSTDIGVSESSGTAAGMSLQLIGGPGMVSGDFTWSGPAAHSRGSINVGQSFSANSSTTLPGAGVYEAVDSCGISNQTLVCHTNVKECVTVVESIFRAWDHCGNMVQHTAVVQWRTDTNPPVIECPGVTNFGCNPFVPVPDPTLITAHDTNGVTNCGLRTVYFVGDSHTFEDCSSRVDRVYIAIDNCDNATTCTQTFWLVYDHENPDVLIRPAEVLLGCVSPDELPDPVASITDVTFAVDNCGLTNTQWVGDVSTTQGCEVVLTRTYGFFDVCGNERYGVQTFRFNTTNTVPPPSCAGEIPSTHLGCNPTLPSPNASRVSPTSACGIVSTIRAGEERGTNGCEVSLTNFYESTDICGQVVTCSEVFVWTHDILPPVVTAFPVSRHVGCNPSTLASFARDTTVTYRMFDDNAIEDDEFYGSGNDDAFASYGAARFAFTTADFGGTLSNITRLVLNLTFNDRTFSDGDMVEFFLTTDDLAANFATLRYQPSAAPSGIRPADFASLVSLGTYPHNSAAPGGSTITHVLTPGAAALDAIRDAINAGDAFYILIGATDDTYDVTYSGLANSFDPGNPNLMIEASTDGSMGVGISLADFEVADNCGIQTQYITCATNVDECLTMIECTYVAIDNCGNEVRRDSHLTFTTDTNPPVMLSGPTGVVDLGCNPGPMLPPDPTAFTFIDTCGDVTVYLSNDVMLAEGPCTFMRELIYTAFDDCSNATSVVTVLNWVEDNEPPALSHAPSPFLDLGCNPTPMMLSNAIPCLVTNGAAAAIAPWINELHYDDASTDNDEGYEIVGPAGLDLTGYTVVHYRDVGTVYRTENLSGVIPNQMNGYGAIWWGLPVNGLQNGSADGLALVDPMGNVIELLSYEGTLTATEGPANGMMSTDIGVSEGSSNPEDMNLQRIGGPGSVASDFTWTGPTAESRGTLNVGQSFVPLSLPQPGDGVYVVTDNCGISNQTLVCFTNVKGCVTVVESLFSATDNCGNRVEHQSIVQWSTDTNPPVIECLAATNLGCNPFIPAPDPTLVTAHDTNGVTNCGLREVVFVGDSQTFMDCSTRVERVYMAIDNCDNIITCTQVFFLISDQENPQVLIQPEEVLLGCQIIDPNDIPDPIQSITDATFSVDNCTLVSTQWAGDVTNTQDCIIVITRTFEFEDECGNLRYGQQTIRYNSTNSVPPPACIDPAAVHYLGCNPTIPPPDPTRVNPTSACGIVYTHWIDQIVTNVGDGGCIFILTNFYETVDVCGQTAICTEVMSWTQDTDPPVIVEFPSDIEFEECVAEGTSPPTPDVDLTEVLCNDNCGDGVLLPPDFVIPLDEFDDFIREGNNCDVQHVGDITNRLACETVVRRTFRLYDTCGNWVERIQTFSWKVDDGTAPLLLSGPTNVHLGCNPSVEERQPPPASDWAVADIPCGVDAVWLDDLSVTQVTDCLWSQSLTYVAEDQCGNAATATIWRTWILDTFPPVVTACPDNVALETCFTNEAAALGWVRAIPPQISEVIATDNCEVALTVHLKDSVKVLGCNGQVTRTFRVFDGCDNYTDHDQIFYFHMDDQTAPVITPLPDLSLGCINERSDIPVADPTLLSATDACDDVEVAWLGDETNGYPCAGIVTRVYGAVDVCRNASTMTQTIWFVLDREVPVLTDAGPLETDLGCITNVIQIPAAGADELGYADNCTATVTVVRDVTNAVAGSTCDWIVDREYQIVDTCNNAVLRQEIISFRLDTVAPVIDYAASMSTNVDLTGDCNPVIPVPDPANIVATDACGRVHARFIGQSDNLAGCATVLRRVYRLWDDCGNSTDFVQEIRFVDDTEPPEVAIKPADILLGCITDLADVPAPMTDIAAAIDNCRIVSNSHFQDIVSTQDCYNVILRVYEFQDACGNVSYANQTIRYAFTNTVAPPTCQSVGPFWLGCNPTIPPPDPSSVSPWSDCGIIHTRFDGYAQSTNAACYVTRTNFYVSEDICGQEVTCEQVLVWREDQDPPVIDSFPSDVTGECVTNPAVLPLPTFDGSQVVCTDNCQSDIEVLVIGPGLPTGDLMAPIVTSTTNPAAPMAGIVDDGDGGASITRVQDGTGIWSNHPAATHSAGVPNGSYVGTPVLNEVMVDADAGDGGDGGEWFEIAAAPDTDLSGWMVFDGDGAIRIPPGSIVPDDGLFVAGFRGAPKDISDADIDLDLATCNCAEDGGSVTFSLSNGGEFLGLYDPSFTLVDGLIWDEPDLDSNNAPTGQVVSLVATPGMVEGTNTIMGTNCVVTHAGDITNVYPCEASVTRTYRITDVCGNWIERDQVFTWSINDRLPPQPVQVPIDQDLGCNPAVVIPPSIHDFVFDDACGVALQWITRDEVTGTCDLTREIEVAAIDGCGNMTSLVHTIRWTRDSEAPILACPPAFDLDCFVGVSPSVPPPFTSVAEFEAGGGTATDACGIAEFGMVDEIVHVAGCRYTVVRTYAAVDGCGNRSTCDQIIVYRSSFNPPLMHCPASADLGCNPGAGDILDDEELIHLTRVETDCDYSLSAGSTLVPSGTCTWIRSTELVAIDQCGHASTCVVVQTWREDVKAPYITQTEAGGDLGCVSIDEIPAADPANILAADGECGIMMVTNLPDVLTSNGCHMTLRRTYRVMDFCGNYIDEVITYRLVADTEPPLIIQDIPRVWTLGCNPGVIPPADPTQIIVADNCAEATVTWLSDSVPVSGCMVEFERLYQVSDGCGNGFLITQLVTYATDTTPPQLSINPAYADLGCAPDHIPTASESLTFLSDGCKVIETNVVEDMQRDGCRVTLTRSFVINDLCSNTVEASQTLMWIDDYDPPVIDPVRNRATELLLGCNPSIIPGPNPLDVVATDACGSVEVTWIGDDEAPVGCSVERNRRYLLEDDCGNRAVYTQRIAYTLDTVPPVVILLPFNRYLGCGDATLLPPVGEQVNASHDGCILTATNHLGDTESVDGCIVRVERRYEFYDACSNRTEASQQFSYRREVNMQVTCLDDQSLSALTGCAAVLPDYTALLEVEGCGPFHIVQNPPAGTTIRGTASGNEVRLHITDDCGNKDVCRFQVNVVCAPAVALSKTVYWGHDNGESCQGDEYADAAQGDPLTYCFAITNIGDVHLTQLQLTDNELATVPAMPAIVLAPGQVVTVHVETTYSGPLLNRALVLGTPSDENGEALGLPTVDDEDTAEVGGGSARLGDTVWYDLNGNGAPDENLDNLGIPGVTVELYRYECPCNPMVPDMLNTCPCLTSNLYATTTTGDRGWYEFDELPAGSYGVRYDPTTLPDDIVATTTPAGYSVTLTPGEVSDVEDFGFIPEPTAVDLVWIVAENGQIAWKIGSAQDLLGFRLVNFDTEEASPLVPVRNQREFVVQVDPGRYTLQVIDTSMEIESQYAVELLAERDASPQGEPTQVLEADESPFEFTSDPAVKTYLVLGPQPPVRILDMTDPDQPVRLRGELVETEAGSAVYFSVEGGRAIRIEW